MTADTHAAGAPERLGERFIRAGLLTSAQVEQVVLLQQAERIRFGEAAVRLGVLSEQQVLAVLSEQFNYATASPGSPNISPLLAIARQPFGAEAEAIRHVRAIVAIRLAEAGRQRFSIAIVSPNAGEGRTYLATSLAVAFSQTGQRTLLVNANLRGSGQGDLYGLARQNVHGTVDAAPQPGGLSTLLAGLTPVSQILTVPGFPMLDVLPAGPQPPNPLELLAEPRLRELLDSFGATYPVILVDTPAALDFSDARVLARQTDGCILLGRKDVTRLKDLRHTQDQLLAASAAVLGTVYCALPQRTDTRGRRFSLWRRRKP